MTRIIIVEDDPMILEIYQKKFSDDGFEVFTATTGDQALEIALKEKVDVIMLDLIMPKMDGFQLIQNLRSDLYDPNIKIIISSNLSQKEDRDKAMALGANSFIAKADFTPTELVNEIKRLMNQYSEQAKNSQRNEIKNKIKKANTKKILLIEDEEVFIEMFSDKLRENGYEVFSARNGAWGVKEALKNDFDLFVIDMIMPAMTGEEMIAKLKAEDKTKNKPIIALSASVEDAVGRRLKSLGIQAFFVKTQITPGKLVEKINELLKCNEH